MQLRQENSLLVICKMLRLFINTSTADDKYSLLNGENLTQQIHMQFSEKQKTLSGVFFFAFLKSMVILGHFQEKDDPHSSCISQLTHSERRP